MILDQCLSSVSGRGQMPSVRSAWLPRALVLAGGLALSSGAAFAVPFTSIAPGLTASGSAEFVIDAGVPRPFSDGNVTQTGDIRTKTGGVVDSKGFTTTPGVADGTDDGTTINPSANPLNASLSDIGDGVGASTNLDALYETGFNFNEGYDFLVELFLDLGNTSLEDSYTVTIQVDYSNAVDAGSVDSWAESKLDVEYESVDKFGSDVLSDGFFGDDKNGTGLGTFGDTVSDIGTFFFDVVLAAGESGQVAAFWGWEGGVYNDGDNSNVDFSLDISIAEVICTSGPCTVVDVPTPGTLALLGLGLSGLIYMRRRSREGVFA